jgi:hypothetical protein
MSISEAPISGLPISASSGAQNPLFNVGDALGYTNDRAVLPPTPNYLICDRTGFKIDRHEGLKKEWTGALVRKESWEPRHPQDYVRSPHEHSRGSPRPEQEARFGGGVSSAFLEGTVQDDFPGPAFVVKVPEAPFLEGLEVGADFLLFWTAPTYYYPNTIASYTLFRSVNGGTFLPLVTTDVSDPREYLDTGLVSGNLYQYYVVANGVL